MARRKYVWEIGLANLREAYERARTLTAREEEDFYAAVKAGMDRPVDWRSVELIESYDELEFALLRSLRT